MWFYNEVFSKTWVEFFLDAPESWGEDRFNGLQWDSEQNNQPVYPCEQENKTKSLR